MILFIDAQKISEWYMESKIEIKIFWRGSKQLLSAFYSSFQKVLVPNVIQVDLWREFFSSLFWEVLAMQSLLYWPIKQTAVSSLLLHLCLPYFHPTNRIRPLQRLLHLKKEIDRSDSNEKCRWLIYFHRIKKR